MAAVKIRISFSYNWENIWDTVLKFATQPLDTYSLHQRRKDEIEFGHSSTLRISIFLLFLYF